MKTNIVCMTLTNESVEFTPSGIWIQPLLSDRFKFAGYPDELISILINHPDIELDNCKFYVRTPVRPYSEIKREWMEKYGTKEDI